MSELLRLQYAHTELVARLIVEAIRQGYWPRLRDAFRDPRVTYGHPHSTHRVGLAVDLLLDRPAGHYLTKSEDYRSLGEWWETQHPLARWGGRFGDGNHFSFEWQGVR